MARYLAGLDLGRSSDFSALAVLGRERGQGDTVGPSCAYAVGHLQRFPLGTPYPRVVDQVIGLLGRPPLTGDALLVVDATGVGRAVADLLRERLTADSPARLLPVSITAGKHVSRNDAGGLNVPKRELIGALRRLVGQRRLAVARSLPDAAALLRELQRFRTTITASAHETFGAQRGGHDDLVLAVALAAWAGEAGRGAT